MDQLKSSRGGRRLGAGRKPLGDKPLRRYQVMLSEEHVKKAKRLSVDNNLSAGVRFAVENV